MSFALPWVLALAAIGVVAITVLHLLSVHRPPPMLLPTARFLPERDIRAVSRSATPNDVLLLLLRIAAIVAVGVALARPRAPRGALTTLAVVAVEPGVRIDTLVARQLVVAELGARRVQTTFVVRDQAEPSDPASLFPAATRAAARVIANTPAVDSVALFLVQGTSTRADSLTPAWRAAWPGRVVYVRTADTLAPPRRRLMLAPRSSEPDDSAVPRDDVVYAAFRWHIARVNGAMPSSSGEVLMDSVQLMRAGRGARATSTATITIDWPVDGRPTTWGSRAAPDSARAIVAREAALIGTWPRLARYEAVGFGGTEYPIVWFGDGDVAAVDRPSPSGCERTVAVVPNQGSDLLLSASANGVFDALLAPCPATRTAGLRAEPAAPRIVARDGETLAPATAFRAPSDDGVDSTPQSFWWRWMPSLLLGVALLVLMLEWRVRERHALRAGADAVAAR